MRQAKAMPATAGKPEAVGNTFGPISRRSAPHSAPLYAGLQNCTRTMDVLDKDGETPLAYHECMWALDIMDRIRTVNPCRSAENDYLALLHRMIGYSRTLILSGAKVPGIHEFIDYCNQAGMGQEAYDTIIEMHRRIPFYMYGQDGEQIREYKHYLSTEQLQRQNEKVAELVTDWVAADAKEEEVERMLMENPLFAVTWFSDDAVCRNLAVMLFGTQVDDNCWARYRPDSNLVMIDSEYSGVNYHGLIQEPSVPVPQSASRFKEPVASRFIEDTCPSRL